MIVDAEITENSPPTILRVDASETAIFIDIYHSLLHAYLRYDYADGLLITLRPMDCDNQRLTRSDLGQVGSADLHENPVWYTISLKSEDQVDWIH